jgi:hypothetical protein
MDRGGNMGGYAYLIWGQLDEGTVFSPKASPSLLGEVSGRHAAEPGAAIATRLKELLLADFVGFLEGRIGSPWPSTSHILKHYLQQAPAEYLVRRVARNGEQQLQWCLQITFSGCSGLAEVSSRVATHWTEIWYRNDNQRIDAALLRPVGFFPSELEEEEPMAFLPIGDSGYAEYIAEGPEAPCSFELDSALYDGYDAEELIRELSKRYSSSMSDGGCRCQLCAPRFDHTGVPGLRAVK